MSPRKTKERFCDIGGREEAMMEKEREFSVKNKDTKGNS